MRSLGILAEKAKLGYIQVETHVHFITLQEISPTHFERKISFLYNI